MTHMERTSEYEMLETALEVAGMAWWWMELPSGTVFFSPNKAKMLERDPADFFHYSSFVDLVHPEDRDRIMQTMQDHLDGKTDQYETIYRIMKQDGSYMQFYDKGKIVGRKNSEIYVAGVVIDTAGFTVLQQDT